MPRKRGARAKLAGDGQPLRPSGRTLVTIMMYTLLLGPVTLTRALPLFMQ